jgi:NADPH-dependent 2,4-dienoyl-CoA reductase/sulfur reductase-like enzyme/ferredoxin
MTTKNGLSMLAAIRTQPNEISLGAGAEGRIGADGRDRGAKGVGMPVAYLRLRADGEAAETLSFSDELTLGRDSIGQSGHRDERLSRQHARVFVKADGQLWVEDLGSTNGTYVNGKRIHKPRKVGLGDEIMVGRTTLEVVAADGAGATVKESRPIPHPRRGRRRPSLVARWRENRATRAQLPPFPNYTQIPSVLSIRAWWMVRTTGVISTFVVVGLCFIAPSTGLRIVWGIGIPLLPILFFVAPGLWRNICPLAASKQTPRVLGWTRALEAPAWLKRYGYLISITLFVLFITLRKVGLQTNGPWSGALLLFALVSGFTGGMFLKGKSGWCSSICPLLPVQRIYGQTPFALVGNSHCQPCVGCTKNCYDFNPKVAYLADLNDEDTEWYAGRKAFIAAFPGLILGFFKVADVPAISVPAMYGQLALYAGVSALAFIAADAFVPVSSHKLTTLWAAAALNIFYWFGFPVIYKAITNQPVPSAATWAARVVVFGLTAFWVVRTYLKERAFVERAGGPKPVRGAGGRSIVSHSAAKLGKPEITFLPDEERIIAEPGLTLLEVAESNGLQIEAGCRMGVCGADPVAIVSGMDNLSEITDDERATLERIGLAENTRMACCCRIRGPAKVSLTPEEPQELTPSQIQRLDFNRSVERVVVVGNGIAGITAADYVRRNHPECSIDVVADETHQLYNRMAITRLIYGRSAMLGLYLNAESWSESRSITEWLNTRAQAIDRDNGRISLGTGEELAWDRLILATGSQSFVPPIGGWGTPGTFVLRTAADAIEVRAFAQLNKARRAVVAGGGLLGLEAAYALHKLGLATTVLERSERLLRRQLDERAAELLHRYLEGLGISVWTQAETAEVSHNGRVGEVVLKDARTAEAEVLIAAAGIAPNLELAKEAGLETNRGVIVDDHMRTSDERIFAAGDVAEFHGQVAGLWPAAVDQARVAAEAAVLAETSPYQGTVPVTVLKVVGVDLTSIGEIEPRSEDDEVLVQEDESELRYGKLLISDGQIIGAILLGYSREVAHVTSAVKQGWDVTPVLDALRAGRWDALERLGHGRSLSAISVVGVGAA